MVLESPIPFAFFEILAENVHAAINVGIDKASVRRAVQATLDTLPAELRCSFNTVFWQGIHIKAGCLACIAFLLGYVFNPVKLEFAFQFLTQLIKRNIHKVLVVRLADADVLLHFLVVANHNVSDIHINTFSNKQ